MKKLMCSLFAVVLFAGVLALAGCSSSSSGAVEFGDGCKAAFNGKTLEVALPANATTGYEWTYGMHATVTCEETESKYEAPSGDAVGAGGTQKYKFKIASSDAGTVQLDFTYARSWETSDSDLTYYVEIETNKSGNIVSIEAR